MKKLLVKDVIAIYRVGALYICPLNSLFVKKVVEFRDFGVKKILNTLMASINLNMC